MFGLGFGELLVVLIIALVFLGPEKIPQTARTLGRWMHELKNSFEGVKDALEEDLTEPPPSKPKPPSPLPNLKPPSHEPPPS